MNTIKFKLELGTIPESIPELTPVAIESIPQKKPESEDKTEPESQKNPELKLEPESEAKIEPESQKNPELKLELELKSELNSIIKKIDSVLTVDESIKTLTQSINYHNYVDSLPHFIENDKPKIKKVMFNFEPIISNEPIIPNEPINLQKDIPELDSDDSYCTCILSKKSDS